MRASQSGQLMVVVAFAIVVFLGFAGLVIDLGVAYSKRRLAQNAADAAAMAAIRMVRTSAPATPGSTIYAEILRVAGLNGNSQVSSADTIFLSAADASLGPVQSYSGSLDSVAGVRVRTTITNQTLFAGAFGSLLPAIGGQSANLSTLTSGGGATAKSLALNGVTGTAIWPIVTMQQSFTPGGNYTIWDDNKEAAGNAGWTDLNGGGGGASELSGWMANGFQSSPSNQFAYRTDQPGPAPGSTEQHDDTLPFPSWIPTATGNKASVLDAMTVGQTITVMVFTNLTGSGGNVKYRVTGLAQFTITSIVDSGSNKQITGTYQRAVIAGDASTTVTTGSMSTVRLTN